MTSGRSTPEPVSRVPRPVLSIQPLRRFEATLRPPGSKSLTNRALLLAALAGGRCLLRHVLFADDTRVMMRGLGELGWTLEIDEAARSVAVEGTAGRVPRSEASLGLGNAGTAMRFLTAACCLGTGPYRLDGVARMRERPIGELVEPLRAMGARIDWLGSEGFPPLQVRRGRFAGGRARLGRTLSSQFISALLQVGPCTERGLDLELEGPITSLPYVEMTLGLMARFGVEARLERSPDGSRGGARITVPASGPYRPTLYEVEPDASSASYFLAAAAILPGSRCRVEGLGDRSLQGDRGLVRVLEAMGAAVETGPDYMAVTGPQRLRGVDVDLGPMPDMAQTLAVVALFAEGPTTIRNVGNLRVKETDRLQALQAELTRLGARVHVEGDDLHVAVGEPGGLRPAEIETYDDHRMAMSFAVAGLRQPGVRIRDPACVNKTFPDFWERLQGLADAGRS